MFKEHKLSMNPELYSNKSRKIYNSESSLKPRVPKVKSNTLELHLTREELINVYVELDNLLNQSNASFEYKKIILEPLEREAKKNNFKLKRGF